MGVLRTGRDAYDNGISKVHICQRATELPCSPTGIDVPAILEADDHPAGILLLERGPLLEPLWDVAVKGELHHGYHYYRVRKKAAAPSLRNCRCLNVFLGARLPLGFLFRLLGQHVIDAVCLDELLGNLGDLLFAGFGVCSLHTGYLR